MRTVLISIVMAACLASARAAENETVLLWPQGAPGAVGAEDQDKPLLGVYLPPEELATGCAIVVCPGGGYGALASDHEGRQVAQWLNSIGVTSLVLKYRLGPRYRHPAPLQDVQRALRWTRHNAERLGVAKDRIGVMGFSAGGHLASTAATHFEPGQDDHDDPIQRESSRPDFAVLAYPVISMVESFGHAGSRNNLLGREPDPKLAESLSSERQVTPQTPPTFLFHTSEDAGVPVENSLAMFAALRKAQVPAELHVYQLGPHGVGLASGDPALSTWKDRLADWLKVNAFLADFQRAAVEGEVKLDGQPIRWGVVTFIPKDTRRMPTVSARIVQGKFRLSAASGPVVGVNRLELRNLGAVEPQPTIEGEQVIARQSGGESPLKFEVLRGPNVMSLDLKSDP